MLWYERSGIAPDKEQPSRFLLAHKAGLIFVQSNSKERSGSHREMSDFQFSTSCSQIGNGPIKPGFPERLRIFM